MRRQIISACAVGAAVLLVGAGAHAYATYGKWAAGTTTFYINPVNADVSSSAALSALQTGMNVWNTQSGSSFSFQYGGTTTKTTSAYDNQNVVFFRNTTNGGAIATTYSWWDSSNRLLDSDIIFWDSGFAFFTGSSGCGVVANAAYIEDVAVHEYGHAMGLSHSTATDASMYPSYGYCSQAFRTLASDDINGAKYLYPPTSATTNTAPTVSISSPLNGASVTDGTAVTFSASASDTQDGNLGASIQWTDNGTSIGQGASFSRVLTVGSHTIVARVTDSGGLQASRQVGVTVVAATTNTAPTVSISSPLNGASVVEGTSISFSGSASDTQDGNLTSSIQWTDNGTTIGQGASFSRVLTVGSHTIVARVTDSGGLQGSKQISVTVTAATTTSNAPVLKASGRKIKGAQAADLSWSGLSATSIDVYRNGAKVMTTPNDGFQTDSINKKGGGSYTYKACAAGTTTCSNTASVTF